MRRSSLDTIDVGIDRELSSQFDAVKAVAGSIDDVNRVSAAIEDGSLVAANSIAGAIQTVGGIAEDVVVVSENISSIQNVADNIVDIQNAEENALVAITKAGEALVSATTATAQAGIATTKSTEAANSAMSALVSKNAASVSEGNSLTSANNADVSEANALASANSASSSATTATNKATEASTSASNSLSSENSALDSKNSAIASASIATTKASEASGSASAALVSEDNAAASELNASNSANVALTQAGIATTKASEARDSADGAAQSETEAITKAAEASQSAANALISKNAASVSESNAANSASAAAVSESAALDYKNDVSAMKLAVETLYDAFDDRFLGAKISDPIADNDGDVILDGAMYFNTTTNVMKVYDIDTTSWYTIPQKYLSHLLDVELTSIATGHMLKWDGENWINYLITKSDVGLSNVDNTSDANKPVSTATQTALNLKVAITDIRDNLTSFDTNKPLSANQGKILKGLIDDINTILASDDTTLDQIQEIVNFIKQNKTKLDTLGVSNIAGLQTALNNKVDGSQVLTNVPSGAKFTDTVYTHPSTHPASMITEDTTHRFATDSEKSTWNAKANTSVVTTTANGLMSSTDKSKLDGIAANANNYVLPEATSTTIGGVKVSDTTQTVAANAVTATTTKTYAVQLDASNNAVVNVPWVDTNTVYTHPTSGVAAGTYRSVTVNTSGHITAGTNPTTVSGYGLTDVYTKTENNTSLALKVNNSEKGVANGIATLDTNGKVVLTQIPDSLLGQLEYIGIWNFATLPTATEKGQYWVASVSGNGYEVGDWAVWNGSAFDKVDNTDAVATVAGRTGNVVLTKSDVGLGLVDNTADASKNVLSATKWAAARTVTLSGDVAGSASIDGSANVTITTTVQPNSVALGTDTTGNYVAGVTAGTGISISGTAGEGWSPTITNTAPNVTTNITTTHNATNVVVDSSDGTDGTINGATQTLAGVMTASDKSKLDGITTGATANVGTVTSIATSGAITGGTITSTGTISHSTADGYLHVPATGTTNNGKVLTAGATAGSLSWTAIPSAPVASVAGKTGAVTLVKGDVGLGSVDNTADSTKNVLSATKLTTARTITLSGDVTGSVSIDGSANVTLSATVADNSHNHTGLSGTVQFSGSTGNTYSTSNIMVNGNGATNTIKPGIGFHQPDLYGGMLSMLDGATFQFKRQDGITPAILANDITGNSATATKLATARTIGGVSFDGTANVNLPGVNTIGNQSTTGNAATANALTSGDKTISGTLTLSGSGSYRGISLVSSSTSWAYQEYKSGTNIFHLAFSSVAQTGAPANSMHFRPNGSTTQMYVGPSEVGVNTNLNVTGLVNLGSTQQASVQYNSTDNSIDFIIN